MTTRTKKILTHSGIILLMFVVSCIYFRPILQGKALPQGDIQKSQAMGYEQQQYAKTTGEDIPNWNSSMFSGMPGYQTAVEPQPTVFNAIKSVLIMRHVGWERTIGVLFLYLIGFYVALLAFGCGPWLALLGALAFAFGSYNIIIIEAGHITKAWAMSMMAPIIAGMYLCLKGAKQRMEKQPNGTKHLVLGGVLFSFALTMQILFNHIQITFYTALVGVILGAVYLVFALKERWLKQFMAAVGVLVIGCVLAVACNARHLVVNQEYSKLTMRGGNELTITPQDLYHDNADAPEAITNGLDRSYAFQWSYGVGETYTLLVPGAMGGGSGERVDKESACYRNFHQQQMPLYWGDQPFTSGPVYFGAIVIFLFVVGMLLVKGPERWWIFIASLLAILMSWGGNLMGFNGWLFDHLPLYNKFRTPSMSLVFANMAMVVLAILTLKQLFTPQDNEQRKRTNHALYIGTGITMGLILVVLVLSSGFSFSGLSDQQMAQQYRPTDWSHIQSIFIEDRQALFTADSYRSLILILLTAVVLWLYTNEKIRQKGIIIGAMAVLMVIDLWGVDSRYLNNDLVNRGGSYVRNARDLELKPDAWDYEIDQQAALFGDKGYRCLNLAVSTFNDSKPSAFHHQVGGYSAAKLRRYQDIIDFYIGGHINWDVLNMLNARYIVTPNGQVQRNANALGNCWFVDTLLSVASANEEIVALNSLHPATTAVVDTSHFALKTTTFAADSADVIVCEHQEPYAPDYMKYRSHSSNERLAVFSEVYYTPDWKAYIDGKPAEYIRANYILRAMVIPAGDHVIEFRNEAPTLHKWNTLVCICSIITLLIFAGAIWLVCRKKETTTQQ